MGEFQTILNSYSYIAMARRKLDGSLRGMILVKVEQTELDGKKINLMTVSVNKVLNYQPQCVKHCLITDGVMYSS